MTWYRYMYTYVYIGACFHNLSCNSIQLCIHLSALAPGLPKCAHLAASLGIQFIISTMESRLDIQPTTTQLLKRAGG